MSELILGPYHPALREPLVLRLDIHGEQVREAEVEPGYNRRGVERLLGAATWEGAPALAGSTDYAALKEAGVPLLGYGEFVTQAVNFVIVAFIIFLIIRAVNRLVPKAPDEVAVDPADVVLLLGGGHGEDGVEGVGGVRRRGQAVGKLHGRIEHPRMEHPHPR